jgi:large subunit ribosomal protein L6
MSRIGKKPVVIPEKTEVTVSGSVVTVKGPLATLVRDFQNPVTITVVEKTVVVEPTRNSKDAKSAWGAVSAHIANMVAGVNKPFEKKLVIEGIGYKADVKGTEMTLNLGFSHPIKVVIPKELKVTTEKGLITIVGSNIEMVGRFAAEIRDLKKPEPYKGKGIMYQGEVVRRKQGKKTV